MKKLKLKVKIIEIEQCENNIIGLERERYWICKLMADGHSLKNVNKTITKQSGYQKRLVKRAFSEEEVELINKHRVNGCSKVIASKIGYSSEMIRIAITFKIKEIRVELYDAIMDYFRQADQKSKK